MAKDHTLLKIGGAAVAALAGYEFVYKPWRLAQDAALGTAAAPSLFTNTSAGGNFGLPIVTTPQSVGPSPSNLNPGGAVGGPIGTCMFRKGWTQTQCQARYDAVVSAFRSGTAALASLTSGQAAASAQAQLDAAKAALASATAAYTAATAAGNTGQALLYQKEISDQQSNIAAAQAALSAIPGRITAYQSALAGLQTEYQTIFGAPITGAL